MDQSQSQTMIQIQTGPIMHHLCAQFYLSLIDLAELEVLTH